MKVLSLLQPWASLVVLGHKKIETRSWNTKYRGELLIHASKRILSANEVPFEVWQRMESLGLCAIVGKNVFTKDKMLPHGAIIGKVNLEATMHTENIECTSDFSKTGMLYSTEKPDKRYDHAAISEQEYAFGDYSPGRFGWLLSDPVVFNTPIPAKGMLGLWEYDYESRIKAAEELERDGYL